ncbi:hypothetical protein OH77DRAFT_763216 [Trametes cingulata]|nr:hypothetical protein OH77DRAFT_763216 [Trametes cingulata]
MHAVSCMDEPCCNSVADAAFFKVRSYSVVKGKVLLVAGGGRGLAKVTLSADTAVTTTVVLVSYMEIARLGVTAFLERYRVRDYGCAKVSVQLSRSLMEDLLNARRASCTSATVKELTAAGLSPGTFIALHVKMQRLEEVERLVKELSTRARRRCTSLRERRQCGVEGELLLSSAGSPSTYRPPPGRSKLHRCIGFPRSWTLVSPPRVLRNRSRYKVSGHVY